LSDSTDRFDAATVSLERRVKAIEARSEICDLHQRYARAIDERDLDLLIDQFTEDGAFRHYDGSENAEGREGLRAFYDKRFRVLGPSYHYPHGQVVELAEDLESATGVVPAHSEFEIDGGCVLAGMRYLDNYRIEDGRWRFAERVAQFWYYMPIEYLSDRYGGGLRRHWPRPNEPSDLPHSLPTWQAFRGTER
jgi:ketosteroid isomerase-like protein